ncbi:MAG: 50S ribosomal protein L21, partial [Bryobacteraceae bacterium]
TPNFVGSGTRCDICLAPQVCCNIELCSSSCGALLVCFLAWPTGYPKAPDKDARRQIKKRQEDIMYAVFEAGGKQYRVAPGDTIRVERMPVEVGEQIEFKGVRAVAQDDGQMLTGSDIGGAKVVATVSAQGRGPKIIVFKFKRKKQYKRTIGHRQNYTQLTVNEVLI